MLRHSFLNVFAPAILLLLSFSVHSVNTVLEQSKLTASDSDLFYRFGHSLSVDGDRMLVGSPYHDNINGNESGAAYIFDYDGTHWVESAQLLPSDGAEDDKFGISVSISGDKAVVGSKSDAQGYNSGAVYVYEYDGANWLESAKLLPSDGAESDLFGESVSLSGDRVLIGSIGSDGQSVDAGAVFVYEFDGVSWAQSAKLTASDGVDSDRFGSSVSLSGDRALIGDPSNFHNSSVSGAAYIFDFNGNNWAETTKLVADDPRLLDYYGNSVSLDGERAIVGVFGDDDNGTDSGSAYIYDYNGFNWAQSAKLTASDGVANDKFGISLHLSGNRAVIGASGDSINGGNSGSAYYYEFDGVNWIEKSNLSAGDGDDGDSLGTSVFLANNQAVAGAPNQNIYTGAVYMFDVDLIFKHSFE